MLYEKLVVRHCGDGHRVALWREKSGQWQVRTSDSPVDDREESLVMWTTVLYNDNHFDERRDAVTHAHGFFLEHGGLG